VLFEIKIVSSLLLFSGGLDSMLAAKILQNAGVEVFLINFVSAFFDSKRAQKSAQILDLQKNLIVENFTSAHLKIVKNPPSGWGKNLNPCVDCHSLMLKCAEKIRVEKKIDILATGEVLGQRPFSQNKNAFLRIEKLTNLRGKILRPLSAKILTPTKFEISGKIDREKLEKISGRSRKRQLELAKKFKIENFPNASGGCILTDPQFSKNCKKLLEIFPAVTGEDFQILKFGRFFVFENLAVILVGRNAEENSELKLRAKTQDFLVKMKNFPGPTALVRFFDKSKFEQKCLEFAATKVQFFSSRAREKKVEFDFLKI